MSSIDHQVLIKGLVNNFQTQGIDVPFAEMEGYKEPKQIREFKPDVIGWDPFKEMHYLGMVVSPDELKSDYTEKKIDELSGMMMGQGISYGERIPLYIGVPSECAKRVQEKIEKTGLTERGNIHPMEVD